MSAAKIAALGIAGLIAVGVIGYWLGSAAASVSVVSAMGIAAEARRRKRTAQRRYVSRMEAERREVASHASHADEAMAQPPSIEQAKDSIERARRW
jgi:multidrug resistance efflux pump